MAAGHLTPLPGGDAEIAVLYRDNAEQIAAWRADPQHQAAQQMGRSRWYSHYQVVGGGNYTVLR